MPRRSKSRLVLVRTPYGRESRAGETEYPPAKVKRLLAAAMTGKEDASWGSVAGQLFIAGRLDERQFAAAQRWAERVSRYHGAINAPLPDARAMNPEGSRGGAPPDPDSFEGQRRVRRDRNAVIEFQSAHAVLIGAGRLEEAVVRAVCERNDWPVGKLEFDALKRGLLWLADHWGLTNRRKHGDK